MWRPLCVFALMVLVLGACNKDAVAPPAAVEAVGEGDNSAPAVEAKENLRAIGTGAELYFQDEHANPDDPGTTVTHVFPFAMDSVCTAGGEGGVTEPSATDWGASPWKELGFSMSRPHRFAYCYQTTEDGKRFAAWAETDTNAFCLKGKSDGGGVRMGSVFELKVDQYCEP